MRVLTWTQNACQTRWSKRLNGDRKQCATFSTPQQEDQDRRQIDKLVECRHQEKKEGGRKGKMDEMELRRGRQAEGRTPEVDSTVQQENLE